jgi:hypothetical protein
MLNLEWLKFQNSLKWRIDEGLSGEVISSHLASQLLRRVSGPPTRCA